MEFEPKTVWIAAKREFLTRVREMKAIAEMVKYCGAVVMRNLWRIIYPFVPMKRNRIVFDSFTGEQYSCNPRAIYEYLLQVAPTDFEYVWAFQEPGKFAFIESNKNTTICRYRSIKHSFFLATSRIVVFNFNRTNELPLRKGQIRLQTWHGGGCYKKVGRAIGYNSKVHNWILKRKADTDYTHYISSSQYFSEHVIKDQYAFKGPILKVGMPRNDCLFHVERREQLNSLIRGKYGIQEEEYIILYAPTYRDAKRGEMESIDYNMLKNSVKKRFGKEAKVLYRGHHFESGSDSSADLDVTDYCDMQDLLATADMLITDYSSSIWDFSFTGKPCMLFTPDLQEYQRYRGFDVDIMQWGFQVCESNEALAHAIENFDQDEFEKKMEKHHETLGAYENGTATEKVRAFLQDGVEASVCE
ncbi:MAG: CDP-glycerol glycerophosphotransferase family protein [Clostridiales bacterium]|nr:CDP-glycerol glycerophosphotransferase family protein [Clostridiales bacterium]